eukprot:CAMPEP_0194517210 /NCGR_PEP_ID=MMETSP0253-20130528/50321_1 /TAXON_ID=2966 /ORGANISM="Noctiluca scintillans" /LENGTH=256 /DNA_ID=CAMNT_0039361149 /DNA_START=1 /DNA_END=771 /DNA_ORIENTATION=-
MFDALQCCVSRCDAEPSLVRAKGDVHLESRSDEHDDLDHVKAKIRLERRRSPAESQRCQEEKKLHSAWSTRQPRGLRWKPGVLVFLIVAGSALLWRSALTSHKPRTEAFIPDVRAAWQSVRNATRGRTVATSATHLLDDDVSSTEAPNDGATPAALPLMVLFVVISFGSLAHLGTDSCNVRTCLESEPTEEELTRELAAKCQVVQLRARRRHRLLSAAGPQTQVKEARQKVKPKEKLMTWLSTRAFDCSQWFSTHL